MELTGLVGWRGMVGSVLLDRMQAEGDFALIEPLFFSTSDKGGRAPAQAKNETTLMDAFDIAALKRCDIVITCQGGDYTTEVFAKLRAAGWNGHWIDAASTLRMKDDAWASVQRVNLESYFRLSRAALRGMMAICMRCSCRSSKAKRASVIRASGM